MIRKSKEKYVEMIEELISLFLKEDKEILEDVKFRGSNIQCIFSEEFMNEFDNMNKEYNSTYLDKRNILNETFSRIIKESIRKGDF